MRSGMQEPRGPRAQVEFGTHSAAGSPFVERVLTVRATLRQQAPHVVEYLVQAQQAALRGERAASLLPSATAATPAARALA